MRAYRKREWSSIAVNLTPLIDVVFLIIIFFIIMINFSEINIMQVRLPKADAALERKYSRDETLSITLKSEKHIFVGRKKVTLERLTDVLKQGARNPLQSRVMLRADENIHYDVIRRVMEKIALARIVRIEFSTYKEALNPLEESLSDEASAEG